MGEIDIENRCGTHGNVSEHDRKILEDLRKELEEGDTGATVAVGVIDDLLGTVGEGPQVEPDANKGGDEVYQTRAPVEIEMTKMELTNTKVSGYLEVDHLRGVIYFHTDSPEALKTFSNVTLLRICQLPRPIPSLVDNQLDITHMYGTGWDQIIRKRHGR